VALGLWAIAFLHPLAGAIGMTPVFVSLVGGFLLSLRVYARARSARLPPTTGPCVN